MATKHITDAQVCRAVQDYQDALRAMPTPQLGYAFGMTPGGTSDLPPWPYEILAARTGQCEKVCYRAMERAEGRGYIEYGVSLRTGWLTPADKALLAAAEK